MPPSSSRQIANGQDKKTLKITYLEAENRNL